MVNQNIVMANQTSLTYRLKGIPKHHGRNDARDLVCRLLSLDQNKVRIRSLAQHPLKENEKIATISFSEQPNILAKRPRAGYWPLEEPDDDGSYVTYSLDTHFHGLTPLHDLADEECDAE